jgi:hypothetical protein
VKVKDVDFKQSSCPRLKYKEISCEKADDFVIGIAHGDDRDFFWKSC